MPEEPLKKTLNRQERQERQDFLLSFNFSFLATLVVQVINQSFPDIFRNEIPANIDDPAEDFPCC